MEPTKLITIIPVALCRRTTGMSKDDYDIDDDFDEDFEDDIDDDFGGEDE
jgi:hypothetical protein